MDISWFFCGAGGFFLLTAKRVGHQLANGLKEPDDLPERITARVRWNVLVFELLVLFCSHGALGSPRVCALLRRLIDFSGERSTVVLVCTAPLALMASNAAAAVA
jgi:hypothetical protein